MWLQVINIRSKCVFKHYSDESSLSDVDYQFLGKWATNNSNCSDPKQLLESVVMQFEDVISKVKFKYWNTDHSTTYDSSLNQFKDWYQFDTKKYGRCFRGYPKIMPWDDFPDSGKPLKKCMRYQTCQILALGRLDYMDIFKTSL